MLRAQSKLPAIVVAEIVPRPAVRIEPAAAVKKSPPVRSGACGLCRGDQASAADRLTIRSAPACWTGGRLRRLRWASFEHHATVVSDRRSFRHSTLFQVLVGGGLWHQRSPKRLYRAIQHRRCSMNLPISLMVVPATLAVTERIRPL